MHKERHKSLTENLWKNITSKGSVHLKKTQQAHSCNQDYASGSQAKWMETLTQKVLHHQQNWDQGFQMLFEKK